MKRVVYYFDFIGFLRCIEKMNVEKYFGTRNLYDILQLKRDSTIQEGILVNFQLKIKIF